MSVTLPAGLAPGEHDLVLIGATTGTSVPVPITVASTTPPMVTPTMTVAHSPSQVRAGRTQAVIRAIVRRGAANATGRVRFEVEGQGTTGVNLEDGRASLRLGRFANPGVKLIVVTYLGNATTRTVSKRYFIRVVR